MGKDINDLNDQELGLALIFTAIVLIIIALWKLFKNFVIGGVVITILLILANLISEVPLQTDITWQNFALGGVVWVVTQIVIIIIKIVK